jgi:hypothetical protein
VVTFWNWFVRNPAFLLAGLALASGALRIAEWSLALPVAVAGVVVADAALHLSRRAEARGARRAAALAAASRDAEAPPRVDSPRTERDAAA